MCVSVSVVRIIPVHHWSQQSHLFNMFNEYVCCQAKKKRPVMQLHSIFKLSHPCMDEHTLGRKTGCTLLILRMSILILYSYVASYINIHWMVVSLYSTGILLKVKCPTYIKCHFIFYWLRYSSRVSFNNHWICCTIAVDMCSYWYSIFRRSWSSTCDL